MFSVFSLITGKVAIGLLAGSAVVAGGAGVAAYADLLPPVAQQVAHKSIGAPLSGKGSSVTPTRDPTEVPTAKPTETSKPVGPDATGPAVHGLCMAFAHGGLRISSTAYASLESAAKGASNIASYCAAIPKLGPRVTDGQESNNSEKAPKTHPSTPGLAHKAAPGVRP